MRLLLDTHAFLWWLDGDRRLPPRVRAGTLSGAHRDPFDRMLIVQAQAEGVPIVSNERVFDEYGVERLW